MNLINKFYSKIFNIIKGKIAVVLFLSVLIWLFEILCLIYSIQAIGPSFDYFLSLKELLAGLNDLLKGNEYAQNSFFDFKNKVSVPLIAISSFFLGLFFIPLRIKEFYENIKVQRKKVKTYTLPRK